VSSHEKIITQHTPTGYETHIFMGVPLGVGVPQVHLTAPMYKIRDKKACCYFPENFLEYQKFENSKVAC